MCSRSVLPLCPAVPRCHSRPVGRVTVRNVDRLAFPTRCCRIGTAPLAGPLTPGPNMLVVLPVRPGARSPTRPF